MQVGQLMHSSWFDSDCGEFCYDIGYVKEVYDDLILIKFKFSKKVESILIHEVNVQNGNEITKELKKDGKPVFAKKNIFGRYKI